MPLLHGILMQNTPGQEHGRVVAYASRSLTDMERRYSQTEREALAIVWAVERLHLYLFGGHFKLITDCKPVQLIFGNPKSKPPPWMECWDLRLQGYDFEAVHTEGSQNSSDFLSGHAPIVSKSMTSKTLWQKSMSIFSHQQPFQRWWHWLKFKKQQHMTSLCNVYTTSFAPSCGQTLTNCHNNFKMLTTPS